MIDYIIKSSLCLSTLLVIYYLFLEQEKMHRFNRIFLLFSIVFGLLIPQLELFAYTNPQPMSELLQVSGHFVLPTTHISGVGTTIAADSNWTSILFIIYCLGVCLLFVRSAVNIFVILRRTKKARVIRSAGICIVLVKGTIVPHSFFKYLFLERDAYMKKRIPQEIITHELTHVIQKHSYDILFLELLKIVFWFNPIFIFYKKAIQLNHEFLADESAIAFSGNVKAYQNILLETVGFRSVSFANNLNYSLTKKRLQMMKKHTSPRMTMLKKLALIPLFTVLVFLFSDSMAQQQTSSISKDEFYKGAEISYKVNQAYTSKKYETMSVAERKNLPQPLSPSSELMNKWKAYEQHPIIENSSLPENSGGPVQCRILIDGEIVPSQGLDQYKPSDFGSYSESRDTIGKFTLISINLYTLQYIKSLTGKAKGMMIADGRALIGKFNPLIIIPAKYSN